MVSYKQQEDDGDIGQLALDYTPESEFEESDEEVEKNLISEGVKNTISEGVENIEIVEQETESVATAHADNQTLAIEKTSSTDAPVAAPKDAPLEAKDAQGNPLPPPIGSGHVDGFQLVQATGLTDTSTQAPRGSAIPSFATPTPLSNIQMPTTNSTFAPGQTSAPLPPVPAAAPAPADYNPLHDESKSKQFTARTDYMIAEFFSRQVARLTRGAPEALDRSYRIFQQRVKERLGAQWAHITSQPEVEEAIKRVQEMHTYFENLEKIVRRQKSAIEKVNDVESEVSLWYRKEGVSEPAGSIRDNMLHLAQSYHDVVRERCALISAYDQYADFLNTFNKKAVGDVLDTMKKQHQSRLELDAYGSKLGQLEEKKLKTYAKTPSKSESASLEKELISCRTRFQDAKKNYQNQSTSLIDKAGLLDLKKGVDFAAHIQKIREVHDAFNRGRVGAVEVQDIPEEDQVELDEHGLPKPKLSS